MLAVRLDKEIENDLDILAKSRGSNKSALVREAILRYLEDNEDLEIALQMKKKVKSKKSLKQLREELELDG